MPLGLSEQQFIENSDGFFISSVSETGWPYVQFRGGPAGFARTLDQSTIAWAELRGNRQYITAGNLAGNDKVALFIIDYTLRQRLKILGRARLTKDKYILEAITPFADSGRIEGAFVVTIDAYDWNCPDHITPRFTEAEFGDEMERLRKRVTELETQLISVALE
jgi:predicted pyridoxine 5'-phosphate oxidase superfamily flavin-nucleotide-binding protein